MRRVIEAIAFFFMGFLFCYYYNDDRQITEKKGKLVYEQDEAAHNIMLGYGGDSASYAVKRHVADSLAQEYRKRFLKRGERN